MTNTTIITFKSLPSEYRALSSKLAAGPKLSVGNIMDLKRKAGITQVIDLRRKTSRFSELKEKLFCTLVGIKYFKKSMPIHDTHIPDKKFFTNLADLIYSTKGKTYIHCYSGHHRTNFVAFATLMLKEGEKPNNLMPFLQKYNFFKFSLTKTLEKETGWAKRIEEFKQMFNIK